jgi:hypothetical protein
MMSVSDLTEWAGTIALAITLAACAGLRAWLPLFCAGLMGRLGIAHLGDSFSWLHSNAAIGLFGVATVVEMIGDKIPAIDHALDSLGVLVRPLSGALVAAAVAYHIDNPLWASVFGLAVGAPTAFAPHALKSSVRVGSSVTTMGVANPFLSTAEDMMAIGLAAMAFLVPFAGVALLALLLWTVVRWTKRRRTRRTAVAHPTARSTPAPADSAL